MAARAQAAGTATPIERLLGPFQRFAAMESAGGLVLLAATIVALVWANSPWADSYFQLWRTPVTVGAPGFGLTESLGHWINDGLMAVFFFSVGLEIKRELLIGELASVRRAALPAAAALGGMLVPALIYTAVNLGGPGAAGWGIPMATDIAFALGMLALLAPGAPLGLKVFLAALAIADDLGAVLVIAVFYTHEIHWWALALAGAFLVVLMAANRLGVRKPMPYALLGLGLWAAMLESGVHATVAGVLLALTVPARTRIDPGEFLERSRASLDEFEHSGEARGHDVPSNEEQQWAIQAVEAACEEAQAPLQRIEHDLHGFVAFFIVPLFALANAGVSLHGIGLDEFRHPVTLGVILGLTFGKPIGILLFSWLAVRLRLGALPGGVSWRNLRGVSWLAGIGFTMSLFIAGLALGEGAGLDAAKVGILTASLLAATIGGFALRRGMRAGPPARDAVPEPADRPA
ncbi:MAG TPA: Na+/H+ antiporter NhaA [Longimicrobiales bacterium]|nr:Na+/H+ antiporter NhaA [Longimicrobiales bacterium]